jgi:hypothetical protein
LLSSSLPSLPARARPHDLDPPTLAAVLGAQSIQSSEGTT